MIYYKILKKKDDTVLLTVVIDNLSICIDNYISKSIN